MPRCVRCKHECLGDAGDHKFSEWVIFYAVGGRHDNIIYGNFTSEFLQYCRSGVYTPLSNDNSIYYLGLCPRCKLTDKQIENIRSD